MSDQIRLKMKAELWSIRDRGHAHVAKPGFVTLDGLADVTSDPFLVRRILRGNVGKRRQAVAQHASIASMEETPCAQQIRQIPGKGDGGSAVVGLEPIEDGGGRRKFHAGTMTQRTEADSTVSVRMQQIRYEKRDSETEKGLTGNAGKACAS